MQKETEKFTDSTMLEGMTSLRGVLDGQKNGWNDRRILRILYDASRESKIAKELGFLRHESERQHFEVISCPHEEIESMAIGSSHGGILAECSSRSIPDLTESSIEGKRFSVMLEGIEDPYNFGYALRSLYACGADLIVLSPRNWMSAAGIVARASAGASERLPLTICDSLHAAEMFHRKKTTVVCADMHTDLCVEDAKLPFPLFLIVGGERRGISSAVLKKADRIVKLEYGRNFSGALSAASATAILAYEISRLNKHSHE